MFGRPWKHPALVWNCRGSLAAASMVSPEVATSLRWLDVEGEVLSTPQGQLGASCHVILVCSIRTLEDQSVNFIW